MDSSPNRNPHFVSKDLLKLSDGLTILLGPDDMPADSQPLFYETDELIINLRHTCKVYVEERDLVNILSRHPHLFESDAEGLKWKGKIELIRMRQSDALIMKKYFQKQLKDTKSVYEGNGPKTGKPMVFQLPSTNKIVKTYIWTYSLLQQGQFTEEMARRLKKIIENYYIDKTGETNVFEYLENIICVTAPARILAEAIAKLFDDPPPVLDLGTIPDLDPDEAMRSYVDDDKKKDNQGVETNNVPKRKCIIVTDVVDSTNTVAEMIKKAESANITVLAIAAIIQFKKGADRWIEGVVDLHPIRGNKATGNENIFKKEKYPTAVLYNYHSPEVVDTGYDPEAHELYWVEPYSLRPFHIDTLIKPYYAWEEEEQQRGIPQSICMLDRKECILYGHFKDRNHHNRILIHMRRALRDPEIIYKVCNEIIDFIGDRMPSVIIVPLHSQIHQILPEFKVRLREKSLHVPVICSIAVDLRGRGPYYLLPKEAQEIIIHVSSKRIMFLDDGILSGRTVETFLRAVSKFLEVMNKNRRRSDKIALESILIYCIVNRVGRAASTKWRKISSLFEERTEFKFQDFIRFECPVFTSHDCPICEDARRLTEYFQDNDKINDWIKRQRKELSPVILGSRAYRRIKTNSLKMAQQTTTLEADDFLLIDMPRSMKSDASFNKEYYENGDKLRLQTVEGTLWWYWERGYRGTPPIFLLEKFAKWIDSINGPKGDVRERLLFEVLLWSLDNMRYLRKMSSEKEYSYKEPVPKVFSLLFEVFLKTGSNNIPRILEKAAYVLTLRKDDKLAISCLFELFNKSLGVLGDPKNVSAAPGIILGLYIVILRTKKAELFNDFSKECGQLIEEYAKSDNLSKGYFQNLMNFIFMEASNDEFMSSLALLCRERYKARHHKTVLSERLADIIDKNIPIAKFGYLADAFPRLARWLEVVFKAHLEMTSKLSEEIELLKRWCQKGCKIIEGQRADEKRRELYNVLRAIEYDICNNRTEISRLLDNFNPVVSDIMAEIKKEYCAGNSSADRNEDIDLSEIEGNNISILGDRSLLKSLLINHTSAVLEKHGSGNSSKIKIRIFQTGETVRVVVLNSWIGSDEARDMIGSGNTFANEKLGWERFKAKFSQPEDAHEQGFKSKMVFEFQKGYLKGVNNG